MSSFGRFTQALGGVVETLSYASPTLTLTQSVGSSPLTATIPSGGGISGYGTTGFLPKFTESTIIGNSLLQEKSNVIGLDSTPNVWGGNANALQINDGSIWGISSLNGYASIGGNYYYDGSYKYIKSTKATDYFQYEGEHTWRNAPTGIAGDVVAFTVGMTLDVNKQLQVSSNIISGASGLFNGSFIIKRSSDGLSVADFSIDTTTSIAKLTTAYSVLAFFNEGAERGRFFQGNFLLGTTTNSIYRFDCNGIARISGTLDTTDSISITMGGGTFPRFISNVGAKSWEIGYRSGTLNYEIREDGNTRFSIANGGLATFSGSITTTNGGVNYGGANTYVFGDNSDLYLGTNGNSRIKINSTGNVLINTSTNIASSKLTIESTTQGVLVPRMSEDDILNIDSPAGGLLVYNLDQQVHCFWDSAGWHKYTHTNM
jgi:hypothetical protein